MPTWATLIWNATAADNITLTGCKPSIGFGKRTSRYDQDDNPPDWHDPNRFARKFTLNGIIDATLWNKIYGDAPSALTRASNRTYPKLRIYDEYSGGAATTNDRLVAFGSPEENVGAPLQDAKRYRVTLVFWERRA